MKTWTNYQTDIPRIINNSQTDNVAWATEMVNEATRYLVTTYYFNERTYVVPGGTVAQTQFYNLPPQIKKIISVTITIGGVLWPVYECPSREYWNALNVVTFYQDFPSKFFVYNGQLGIWPIPASNSNVISMYYKTRLVDLSMADVTEQTSSQTVSITTNTTTVTASGGTPFKQWMIGQWLRVPHSTTDATNGDNQWYQIDSVTSGTVLVLKNQYTGASVTGAAFTLGETSILPEDYHDLPLYRMGMIYYTTRFPDATRAQMYQKLWDDGIEALNKEFGSKTTSPVLPDTEQPIINPNLFVKTAG